MFDCHQFDRVAIDHSKILSEIKNLIYYKLIKFKSVLLRQKKMKLPKWKIALSLISLCRGVKFPLVASLSIYVVIVIHDA